MVWHRVAPRLVRQDDPAERRVWYWDDGPLDRGELLLWLDARGQVARFQLAHARFPGRREYLAEWRPASGLRLGEVEGGEGGRFGRAPVVRYARLDPSVRVQLSDYFTRNAAILPPLQRAVVAAAFDAAPPPATSPPSRRLLRPLGDAVSGRAGGTGNGTAATAKKSARGGG